MKQSLTVMIPSNRTYKDGSPKGMDGLNEIISYNRTNRYKAATIERENVEWCAWHIKQAMQQQGWQPMLTKETARPCQVTVLFVEPNRRRDYSNIVGGGLKFLLDALSRPQGNKAGAGAIYDDSQTWLPTCVSTVRTEKGQAYIYLTVVKYDRLDGADD